MRLAGLIKELKQEKDLLQRHLAGIDSALLALDGPRKPKQRTMSAASRAKIAAAQRRRWAKFRKKRKG